jgi:hypothetical protein
MDHNEPQYIYRVSTANGYTYYGSAINAYTEAFKAQLMLDEVVYIDQFELVSSQHIDRNGDISMPSIKL